MNCPTSSIGSISHCYIFYKMIDLNQHSHNLSIIVAMAHNRAIGKDNDLIWHISEDLKHFKALTVGHPVIMGRRTFESLPKRPLPKRRNIVLTHDVDFKYDGVEVAHSISGALKMVGGEDEVFVIGGAAVYSAFLPFAQCIYVTHVHRDFDGDVFFPVIDRSVFRLVTQGPTQHDDASNLDYSYATYVRIHPLAPQFV